MKINVLKKCALFFIALLLISTTYNQANAIPAFASSYIQEEDEFKEFSQEDSTDEFKAFEEFNEDTEDEFKEFDDTIDLDEFTGCPSDKTTCSNQSQCGGCSVTEKEDYSSLYWTLGILLVTIVSGLLVRLKKGLYFRGIILLSSLVILGFWKGGCPCMISSFENLFLTPTVDVNWQSLIWFLGLIPITYIFGRVWCGWVCHLGALQEFLYHHGKIKIFQSEKAQRIMRITRVVLLGVLVTQLLITQTNIWCSIDPFKAAFNLFATSTTTYILLFSLIISSLFIYRPFCKTMCPIGLVLGWISKIPGASIIGIRGKCTSCITCNSSCKINAITRDNKVSKIENQECIACGDCLYDCKQDGLVFLRKNKDNSDIVFCKND